ncbi:hypothetical protein Hanom_Chr10g00897151 [Helianthus anomalus]
MNVVPRTTCIRLGLRTSFSQFDDDTIPYHYFNFVNYVRLTPRIDNHLLLTGIYNYISFHYQNNPFD